MAFSPYLGKDVGIILDKFGNKIGRIGYLDEPPGTLNGICFNWNLRGRRLLIQLLFKDPGRLWDPERHWPIGQVRTQTVEKILIE